jgi:hypothetical protein
VVAAISVMVAAAGPRPPVLGTICCTITATHVWPEMETIMSKTNNVSTPDQGTSVHELTDAELLEVVGATSGKPNPSSISFLHLYDKS